MRRLLTPVAVTTALIAIAAFADASADTTPTAPATPATAPAPRLLTVNGGADATIRSDSSQALFTQTYRTQLSAALDDATATATAIAAKEGLTLGAVQSITEASGPPTSDCDEAPVGVAMASGAAAPTPAAPKKKTPKAKAKTKHPHAKSHVHPRAVSWTSYADDSSDDDVFPCDVTGAVTVTYLIQ